MGGRTNSKRLPRHLRNEDIPRDTFTPRTYQVELLECAARRNTVVCMGSTSGRMFIAAMLMKEMAKDVRTSLSEGGKRTFFLLDTDESGDIVSASIQHPAHITVSLYTDSMGIRQWTQQQWDKQLQQYEALIMTGSTFLQLVTSGVVSLDIVNLLIFHNCHLVFDDHPYKHIMDMYSSCQSKPRILGLTSNFLTGNLKNPQLLGDYIGSLERSLHSVAETSSLVIPERYGIKPSEKIIECDDYEDTTGLNERMYELLEGSIDFLEECNIQISEELDNRDPCQIPKAALIECHNILTHLGPWCAACLADMLIVQIEKIEKQKEFIPMHKKFLKIGATCLRLVSKIFEEHFKHCEYSLEHLLEYSTPKVTELMHCLQKYRPETDFVIISEELSSVDDEEGSATDMSDDDSEFSDNDSDDEIRSPNSNKHIHIAMKKVLPEDEGKTDPFMTEDKCLCGIVFVEQQHEAFALNKFIEEACAWDESLCFVRSSHLTGNKSSTKKQRLYKKQEETLKKFRMQELNVLVSTNILEEGVDVPKCNFVVRFDLPKTYKSYSQSKGRARAREAEYIILVDGEHADQFESELKTYHDIEKVLIGRDRRMAEEGQNGNIDVMDQEVPPFTPSAGESSVSATMETAIMFVNRYCAKLPSDAFTHLTPSCTIEEEKNGGNTWYTALVRLPINSPIKTQIQGRQMSTPRKAKQAAAVKICEILYKQGELDDSLMPMGKEMFEADEEDVWEEETDLPGEARPGTTKRKQYYCKQVATALQQSQPVADTCCFLYVISMELTGPITDDQNTRGRKIYAPEETSRCFGILTAKTIPMVPTFPVFTRSGEVTVSVDMLAREVTMTTNQLEDLKTFHRFLFSNVLRLEKDPMDYKADESKTGYLVVPLDGDGNSKSLEIDWTFTRKVVDSVTNPYEPRDKDFEFVFHAEDFEDAVVMPSYRNIDQPQHFYVAEMRTDLNPLSAFPSPELYKTFAEYYASKYGLAISNLEQPLLDVDHTSARLNLLIPRYMNQKGVPLPTSSAETKKARRENLQQKQILVPELCDVHVFLASLWRKAVCLPAILYRLNYLLLGEEIRKHVAIETKIGIANLPEGHRFPKLDFGIDTSPENLKLLVESSKDDEDETGIKEDEAGTNEDETGIKDGVDGTNEDESGKMEDKTGLNEDETCTNEDKTGINEDQISKNEDKTCTNKDKTGAKEDKTGEIEDKTGAKEDKTGEIEDKTGAKEDKTGTNEDSTGTNEDNEESVRDKDSENACEDIQTLAGKSEVSKKHEGTQLAVSGTCNSVIEDISHDLSNDLDTKCNLPDNDNSIILTDSGPKPCSTCSHIEHEKCCGACVDRELVNNICDTNFDGHTNTGSATFHDKHATDLNTSDVENCKLHKVLNGPVTDSEIENKCEVKKMYKDFVNCVDQTEKNGFVEVMNVNNTENVNCVSKCKNCIESLDKDCDNETMEVQEKSNKDSSQEECNAEESKTEVNIVKSEDESDNRESDDVCVASEPGDIFTKVGKFLSDKGKSSDMEDTYPEPLISLDVDMDLATFVGPSPCELLQALTMSNANDFFSLERLETIGDSFLKYAITVYLYCSYPGIHEGKLSYLRSKQVSNYNLYRLGKRKGLAECMISTKFEPYENWLPPGYIINEDKRKGPVPKVYVASVSMLRSSSNVFETRPVLEQTRNSVNKTMEMEKDAQMENFQSELEEADKIAQAKDEEFESVDRNENPHNLTAYNLQLHHCLPDKSIADCVEALIGCYLTSCDKMAALRFMSWMGLKVLPKRSVRAEGSLLDTVMDSLPCPPSPLDNASESSVQLLHTLLDGYGVFEQKIGYTFTDRSYLLQAFTHASYHHNIITDCYQRLEFLGDAVLDYVITRHLYEYSDKYSPGVLTDLRSALVNNNIFAALAVKWDFHKYFKALSPSLFYVIEKFVLRQKEKEDEIDDEEDDEVDEDHEKEHVELEVPKALGDIFESVAGAIYLDSGMSLDAVWRVFYRVMKPQIDKYLMNIPKSPVRELLEQEPETAKFEKPERTLDGKIRVTVNVVGKGVFTGVGRNYRIAKSAAAKKALRCIKTLEQKGLI